MPDPKLEAIVQRMIDANAPEESIASVIREYNYQNPATRPAAISGGPENPLDAQMQGFKEGALGGAKGFAKEAIPGVVKAVGGIPAGVIALIKELGATAEGAYHLATDPVGTLKNAAESIGSIPGKGSEMFASAMQLAASDPEGFGRAVADVTGQAEVGIASSKLMPLAPKPIARVIGTVAEQVGTKGAWPIRMMGAHQFGSGNPMGIVTMGLPEALKQGGGKLKNWGENEPARVQREIDKFIKPGLRLAPSKPTTVNAPTSDIVGDMLKTREPASTPMSSGGLNALDRKNLVKAGYTPEMIADIEKRATASARPSPTQVQSMNETTGLPKTNIVSEGEAPYTGAQGALAHPQGQKWVNQESAANNPRAAVRLGQDVLSPEQVAKRQAYIRKMYPFPEDAPVDTSGRSLAPPQTVPDPGYAPHVSSGGVPLPSGPATTKPVNDPASTFAGEARPLLSTEQPGAFRPNQPSMVNAASPEALYRELKRKDILTPQDEQTLRVLEQKLGIQAGASRASGVGSSYAAGGKAGAALTPPEDYSQ